MYPKTPFLRHPSVEALIINGQHPILDELLPWLCQTPAVTTYRVNLLQTTAARFKAHVEQLLAQKYTQPPTVYFMPGLPEVVCIGPTNDPRPVPDSKEHSNHKEIIVDVCCAAALLRGAHIYAPGVLAMEAGTQLGSSVEVYADLTGKCKKGTSTRFESDAKMFIGTGTARMQRYQLYTPAASKMGVAIEMKSTISGVPTLGNMSSTEAILQNLPSIVCVRVLDPQPGEIILDMCAAPGNKTSHIAEMMRNEGTIVALDKTESRVKLIKHKIEGNNLTCVQAYAYDATMACAKDGIGGFDNNGIISPPFLECKFDRILLDAPCSALGNRPLLASTMTPKMLQSYPNMQRKLFKSAVSLLRHGGVLVYSTCTVTTAENEGMVAWALEKFPELRLAFAKPKVGRCGIADKGLNSEQRVQVQRFGSDWQDIDTVGFFIAKFIKQ